MRLTLILITVLSSVATAQTLSGINAPVSRTVTLAADEAACTITAAGTLDSTQQQVKQALQSAGLPNPTVVATGLGQDNSRYPPGAAQILYSATVSIPAGSAIDTARNLESLRTHPPAPLQNLQYSVAFNPSQTTVEAMRQVVLPQLLDESRKSAQSLAAAAGVKLGAIRSVSDAAVASGYFLGSVLLARNGDFSQIIGIYDPLTGIFPAQPSSSKVTFSLNVVFATAP